jgi:hypothetical protein
MNDPRRIKVTRLQVIGKDLPSLQSSAFHRPGFEQGYVVAVAGSREVFPATRGTVFSPGPLLIVGKVSSDTGPLEATRKIKVDAAGNAWTIDVPRDTPLFDEQGEKISVHEIAKGQWVRVHGWQKDDLRLRAARVQNIGLDEVYRVGAFYRVSEPLGYVEREPGTGVRFQPITVSGAVTAIDEAAGTFTVRDANGVNHVLSAETLTDVDGLPVDIRVLKTGRRVSVRGSEILF